MDAKQTSITELEVGELSVQAEQALNMAGCTLENTVFDREHPENVGTVKIHFPAGATREQRLPTTMNEHITIWVGEWRFFAQLTRWGANALWYCPEPLIF